MFKSIIGKKLGMIRMFDKNGNSIPATVVLAGPCIITKICTEETTQYNAIQLGFDSLVNTRNLNKAIMGIFKKNNIIPQRIIKEFRVKNTDTIDANIGQKITIDIFNINDYVKVRTISKGKGYAGVIKRHNFKMQSVTHGQSDRTRARGSSGGQGPQKVLKGMKMAGHLGNKYVTIRGLRIVDIKQQYNILLLKGSIPGSIHSVLTISSCSK
ncbi:MAG: 50S ribosomal protein L3 [Lachnospiraceae bacterium]|jgi:large subunit ribosomal protein L3|nr:50S ribosomal protein L3 [Lachnospiraceae bacterium]